MDNISPYTYKSFGLVGSNAVEDHSQCARQKTTLTRRAGHRERLSTSRYPVGKKQTCNNHTVTTTANTQIVNMVSF